MSKNENAHWYANNKKIKIFIHALVWVILIVLPNILNKYRLEAMGGMMNQKEQKFLQLDTIMYVYWIGVYYYNSQVLVPRLLLKRRYFYYVSVILTLLCLTIVADIGIRMLVGIGANGLTHATIPVICYFRFPVFLLIIAAGIAFTVIETERKYEEKVNETDKEGLKTELSFLRSQMSPHFIFNILNNIVSLVRLKSDELEPTVMKLSGLMHYTLYHTEEEKVSLKTEVEYLNNYIDLQKQRFSKKAKITATFELYDENMMIESLLLIPFVENAFKHGTGVIYGSEINILLKTDEHGLYFTVVNKFDPSGRVEKDTSSGIGIPNVSRRLELLYGKDHHLSIIAKGSNFETDLFIKLRHD